MSALLEHLRPSPQTSVVLTGTLVLVATLFICAAISEGIDWCYPCLESPMVFGRSMLGDQTTDLAVLRFVLLLLYVVGTLMWGPTRGVCSATVPLTLCYAVLINTPSLYVSQSTLVDGLSVNQVLGGYLLLQFTVFVAMPGGSFVGERAWWQASSDAILAIVLALLHFVILGVVVYQASNWAYAHDWPKSASIVWLIAVVVCATRLAIREMRQVRRRTTTVEISRSGTVLPTKSDD